MFDLAQLDTLTLSEKGVAMPVRHPTSGVPLLDSAGKPITITLLGRNSEPFRAQQRAANATAANRQARGITATEEERRREIAQFLTECTVTWTFDTLDGQPFPFSKENASKLWNDRRWNWLNEAAFLFITQEGNFLAASAGG